MFKLRHSSKNVHQTQHQIKTNQNRKLNGHHQHFAENPNVLVHICHCVVSNPCTFSWCSHPRFPWSKQPGMAWQVHLLRWLSPSQHQWSHWNYPICGTAIPTAGLRCQRNTSYKMKSKSKQRIILNCTLRPTNKSSNHWKISASRSVTDDVMGVRHPHHHHAAKPECGSGFKILHGFEWKHQLTAPTKKNRK